MARNEIVLLALQETKVNTCCTETRGDYRWYFSSSIELAAMEAEALARREGRSLSREDRARLIEHSGVGIIAHRSLWAHITKVEPISSRKFIKGEGSKAGKGTERRGTAGRGRGTGSGSGKGEGTGIPRAMREAGGREMTAGLGQLHWGSGWVVVDRAK